MLLRRLRSLAYQPVAKVVTVFDRPRIPADGVAMGAHTPGMRAHSALSGGPRNGLGARGTFTTDCYVLEYPELSWLPTEPEKVGCFKRLGIPRRKLPRRVCREVVGKIRRDFALNPPIAVEADRTVFVRLDPAHSTDQGLRSWGVTHRGLWAAGRNDAAPLDPYLWSRGSNGGLIAEPGVLPDQTHRPHGWIRPCSTVVEVLERRAELVLVRESGKG